MALQIIWTEIAVEDYKSVVDYLVEEWSVEIAEKFSDTVQSRLETLSNYPRPSICQPIFGKKYFNNEA